MGDEIHSMVFTNIFIIFHLNILYVSPARISKVDIQQSLSPIQQMRGSELSKLEAAHSYSYVHVLGRSKRLAD